MERKFDLEERLIEFASQILRISEKLPQTIAGRHISGQLVRSGTSPALHYGEAQAAESKKDFVHKMKVVLKELRETYNSLRIIRKMNWLTESELAFLLNENNQLISIFFKSIDTANKNVSEKVKLTPPK